MIQIRFNVFETNSSSVHTLTVCTKEQYEAWQKGNYYLYDHKEFVTLDEAKRRIDQECRDDNDDVYDWKNMSSNEITQRLEEYNFWPFEDYGKDGDWIEKGMTTLHGDEVVAFGYYSLDY